ncbi:MAG: helix-turn-helix domain-containing protein [Chloroflexota bacterium]
MSAETAKDATVSLAHIGATLRAARTRRSLKIEALSRMTSISASTISRLEGGKRQPNLELLIPLTRALGLSLDELVNPSVPDPRVRTSANTLDGRIVVRLSPPTSAIQTCKITLASSVATPDPRVHDGHDWVYVLSGQLRLVLGQLDLRMGPGEAAEFDTRTPHWLGSTGAGPVEVLAIFGPNGERVHLRAGATQVAG